MDSPAVPHTTLAQLQAQLQQILAQRKLLDESITLISQQIAGQEAPAPAEPASPADLPKLSLAPSEIHAHRRMTDADLDRLPYGVITVDARGRVLHYNEAEARAVGLDPAEVIGRNFFTEVAPCTRVQSFYGRFEQFVESRGLMAVEAFDFVFPFPRSPQRVSILFTPGRSRGRFQLCVLRRQMAQP